MPIIIASKLFIILDDPRIVHRTGPCRFSVEAYIDRILSCRKALGQVVTYFEEIARTIHIYFLHGKHLSVDRYGEFLGGRLASPVGDNQFLRFVGQNLHVEGKPSARPSGAPLLLVEDAVADTVSRQPVIAFRLHLTECDIIDGNLIQLLNSAQFGSIGLLCTVPLVASEHVPIDHIVLIVKAAERAQFDIGRLTDVVRLKTKRIVGQFGYPFIHRATVGDQYGYSCFLPDVAGGNTGFGLCQNAR